MLSFLLSIIIIGLLWANFVTLVLILLKPRRPTKPGHKHPRTVRVSFISEGVKVEDQMNLKVNMSRQFGVRAEDEFDNETGELESAEFSLSDPGFGELVILDGNKCQFNPNGVLGSTEIHLLAVAGGKTYEAKLELTLIPGDAVEVVIVPGDEIDNPNSPAPAPVPEEPAALKKKGKK